MHSLREPRIFHIFHYVLPGIDRVTKETLKCADRDGRTSTRFPRSEFGALSNPVLTRPLFSSELIASSQIYILPDFELYEVICSNAKRPVSNIPQKVVEIIPSIHHDQPWRSHSSVYILLRV